MTQDTTHRIRAIQRKWHLDAIELRVGDRSVTVRAQCDLTLPSNHEFKGVRQATGDTIESALDDLEAILPQLEAV